MTWLTVKDCVGLPGLPNTRQGVFYKATAEKWESKKRSQGKGYEYHINSLPPSARVFLLKKQGVIEVCGTAIEIKKRQTGGYSGDLLWQNWSNATDKQREKARAKCEAVIAVAGLIESSIDTITAFDSVGAALNVSPANVRRWYYLAKPFDRSDWLAALVSKHGMSLSARKKKEAECTPDAWDFFLADFLRPEKPALRTCYARLQEAANAHGWSIPNQLEDADLSI